MRFLNQVFPSGNCKTLSLTIVIGVLLLTSVWMYFSQNALEQSLVQQRGEIQRLRQQLIRSASTNVTKSDLPADLGSLSAQISLAREYPAAPFELVDCQRQLSDLNVLLNERFEGYFTRERDSIENDEAPESVTSALTFISQHLGESWIPHADDRAGAVVALKEIFYNAGPEDLDARLGAAVRLGELTQDSKHIDVNIIDSLTNAALADDANAEDIMETVFAVGGHPAYIDRFLSLADNENQRVSAFATRTLMGLLVDSESNNGIGGNPDMYEAAGSKIVEKIGEDPLVLFRALED
ncbi:MAG: hypothetical protein ACI93R_002740 [Flavobacteriales bacterium]|jgi:hypothetical protein